MRLGADRERLAGRALRRRPRAASGPTGPAAPRRPGLRRLLCVGRLVERKGVDNAVRALAELPGHGARRRRRPRAHELDDDPEARRLRALAAERGVADRVDLLGRVSRDDLPALMRSADAVVCVPWYEPFGIVPLEAMACGVPVVASAVGGMIDTVVDGVTGRARPAARPGAPGRRADAGCWPTPRAARASGPPASAAPASATTGTASPARRSTSTASSSPVSTARPRRHAAGRRPSGGDRAEEHLAALSEGLAELSRPRRGRRLGAPAGRPLLGGARVLAVGNGGSAAQAEHFTAELVGRYVTSARR